MKPLLEVERLRVVFRSGDTGSSAATANIAVRDASFSISRGEALGIVGESGSGKSACCYALLGLHPAHNSSIEGSALLTGQQLLNIGEPALARIRGARIGMIFQDPMTALNPHMRIADQLIEPLRLHRGLARAAASQRCCGWLEEVGLREPERIMQSYAHELSGGMRQRVLIAMALVAEPELLLADEPTTALDVSTQAQILALLSNLRKRHNIALLFVSHDLHVVEQVCDNVLVMHDGNIVERGACAAIFNNPQHPYTQKLLAAIPATAKPAGHRYVEGTEDTALDIERLSVIYTGRDGSRQQAVSEVTLSLRRGEVLGLVGESGSGKSSLARATLQLETLREGAVCIDRLRIDQLRGAALRRQRKHIQMIFQDPYASLNPRRTLMETLVEPLLLHRLCTSRKAAQQRAAELLKEVGIPAGWSNRYAHQLSGGQRQRVAIARALAVQPDFLVADEPVSALDVSVQANILELLLHSCSKYRIGMLFITHDIAVVRFVADRMAVMLQGRIVEQGETEALLAAPRHTYTQQLLAASASVVNAN